MEQKSRLGRPKGSSKEDTLSRIMPIARRLFAEKGFAQTTFKHIGAELGVSHAALYSYFSSKKELYFATVEDAQNLLAPIFVDALASDTSLRSRISFILMAIAAKHDQDSSITGLLAAVPIEIRRHPELYEHLIATDSAVMGFLEQMFVEAQQSGEITFEAEPMQLITALLGGGVGVALFQYGTQAGTLTDAMQVFVELIEARLFA